MAVRADALSDDWQDVGDDNLSVVSLPTSDDGSDADDVDAGVGVDADDSGTDTDADTARLLPGLASPVTRVSRRLALLSISDQEMEVDDPTSREPAAAEEITTQPPPTFPPEADSFAQLADSLGEDSDMPGLDPTILLSTSSSLIKLIREIKDVVHFGETSLHVQDGTHDTRQAIFRACDELRRHLGVLGPIMEGYVKHWDANQAAADLPIDPGLFDWLASVKAELNSLQAYLMGGMDPSSIDTQCTVSGLSEFAVSLNDLSEQIASFIPIMQADYNDFHAANLPLVDLDSTSSDPFSPPRDERRVGGTGPNPAIARLRREVYDLKDEISRYLSSLDMLLSFVPSSVNTHTVLQLRRSFPAIKTTLDVLLSNHASEWIEQGLGGGLTYPEFCRLNPDTIRSLNLQLKDISDHMNEERGRIWRMEGRPGLYLPGERGMEIRLTDFDALESIEEILVSIFRTRPEQLALCDD